MKVSQDIFHTMLGTQMYISSFSTHRVEEHFFIALLRQACYLDRIRIGRESADNPSANGFLKGIVRAHRTFDRAVIVRVVTRSDAIAGMSIAGMSVEPGT